MYLTESAGNKRRRTLDHSPPAGIAFVPRPPLQVLYIQETQDVSFLRVAIASALVETVPCTQDIYSLWLLNAENLGSFVPGSGAWTCCSSLSRPSSADCICEANKGSRKLTDSYQHRSG